MTLEDLLARLDGVRRCGRGWKALCPGHQDKTPSLSINEGDKCILLKCWAGCTVEEIAAAMGLRMADFFYDNAIPSEAQQRPFQPKALRFDWREYAEGLQLEADDLWLRGTQVLEHARDLDISSWSESDLENAWDAVSSANTDLVRAECFNRLAVNVRTYGVKKENDRAS